MIGVVYLIWIILFTVTIVAALARHRGWVSHYRSVYQRIKSKSKFTDDPRERLKGIILSLISDPTLPNATAAGVVVTAVGAWFGYVPDMGFYVNSAAWGLTLIIYAVGDEVRIALEAIAAEKQNTDDSDNRGIQ